MDEPTSALDNDTERHVMTALLDSDNACIVVAHRLASIRDFDRIHVMDHGQIVESGTHDELLQAGGLYSRLYRPGVSVPLHPYSPLNPYPLHLIPLHPRLMRPQSRPLPYSFHFGVIFARG